MVKVRSYDHADDSLLKYAVIIARQDGKWVFCKHKERNTLEIPGGHRKPGEDIFTAAKRELCEETGAKEYVLNPVCYYSVCDSNGNESYGKLFYADIKTFEKELHSEIEKIVFLNKLPDKWTYPDIQPELIRIAEEREYREKTYSMDVQMLLDRFLDHKVKSYRVIDSSQNGDYRMNIIIDNRYVLRINDHVITEQRLSEIAELVKKYNECGIKAPCLIRSKEGRYLREYGNKVCYVSEYLDYMTLSQCGFDNYKEIYDEVFRFIGCFAQKYKDKDLMSTNSMWSLIDLAPLDNGIDEKQENLNSLVYFLKRKGYKELTNRINEFNNSVRERIIRIYKKLPRCSIQGDLNWSNILVDDGHFIGLIDFNMAGTEVNINEFICETSYYPDETEFNNMSTAELYEHVIKTQNERLSLIMEKYQLNELEKSAIEDYRSISLISRFPNVCFYKWAFNANAEKAEQFIELILRSN
ncbi:MAG: NUDIX domain-containing protein [Erysipelotrichaceae bacterium]|nr:NUDIX domain-containing protein [Erysipelotrichaceae bacterium]